MRITRRRRPVIRTRTVADRVRSTTVNTRAVGSTPGPRVPDDLLRTNRGWISAKPLKTMVDKRIMRASLIDTASSTYTKYYGGYISTTVNNGRSGTTADTGTSQIFKDVLSHGPTATSRAMDFCTYSCIADAASILFNSRTPAFVETGGSNLLTDFNKSNVDLEYLSSTFEFINNDDQDFMVDFYVFTNRSTSDSRPTEVMTDLATTQLLATQVPTTYGASPGAFQGLEKHYSWTKESVYMTPGQSKKFVFKDTNVKFDFAEHNTITNSKPRFLKGLSKVIGVRIRPRLVASTDASNNLYVGHFSEEQASEAGKQLLVDVKEVYKFRNPAWASATGSQSKVSIFYDAFATADTAKNTLPVALGAGTI